MKIHFVCRGNTFRSRLAEAYLNSKQLPGIVACSSGIEAEQNLNGRVCWYTDAILRLNGLDAFTSTSWTKTTRELLEQSDIVVLLSQDVAHDFSNQGLDTQTASTKTWAIPDLTSAILNEPMPATQHRADEIFELIRSEVDQLISSFVL